MGRQGHFSPVPSGDRAPAASGSSDEGAHVAQPVEFEDSSGKDESVSASQAADEGFFNGPDGPTVRVAHQNRVIGGDGSDVHPVSLGNLRSGHAETTLPLAYPGEFRIRAECGAALDDELHRPGPLFVAQGAERPRGTDFLAEVLFLESPSGHRRRHQMLNQNVQWILDRYSGFDAAGLDQFSNRGEFHELEGVGRYADDSRRRARLMTAATGPLDHPGDSLGGSDLNHLIDRFEVDAQIQAGGAHHALKSAVSKHRFHSFSLCSIE